MTTLHSSNTPTQAKSTDRLFTISNLLSISRGVLTIPFAVVMLSDPPSRLLGGCIMVVAALTDKFDGVLARKYNQITEWGKILDPLSDKIAVAGVAIVLLILGNIPVWYLVALLVRDGLIFSGGIYIKTKKGIVLQSNETGKWAVGIIALTLFLMVLNAQSALIEIALWSSVILMVISFSQYAKRFAEVMKG